MSEDLHQILVIQIFGIIAVLLTSGIPAVAQWRKWRTGERTQVQNASEKTEAETINIWQKTYEELRTMLVARDKEIAELRESDSRHTVEMNNLRIEVTNLKNQLAQKTVSENLLREENTQLKADLIQERSERQKERTESNLKITELENKVRELETKVKDLETAKGN